MASNTPVVDFDNPNEHWHRRQMARAINDALNGHLNSVVDYAGGSGPLIDPRIYPDSLIQFVPLNAAAAGAPLPYADAATITDGQAAVTGGAAGASYRVLILG